MIVEGRGSIFDSGAHALVNPVNCRGVMGAGLAQAFAQHYPSIVGPYRRACARGGLRPGRLFAVVVPQLLWSATSLVVCFPTKDHWKDNSELGNILAGLEALARFVQDREIKSVAVPALGCGLGGLSWSVVRPAIEAKLGQLQADVMVFPPG